MSPKDTEALRELARLHGVQESHRLMSGEEKSPAPECLVAILKALGVEAGGERQIRRALQEARLMPWKRGVEPVITCWDGASMNVSLKLPGRLRGRPAAARLILEDGTVRNLRIAGGKGQTESRIERIRFVTRRLALPQVPMGYHRLQIETGGRLWSSLIIAAPARCYSEGGLRDIGAFLPLYAAHSRHSWGAGSFSDWERLCGWVASAGGRVAGTLPLLAAFLDHPGCDPSPYSPASRLFWNEFYLDIPRIPEFDDCAAARKQVASAGFQERLARFRASPVIDYAEEWKLRRKVLELLADQFEKAHAERRAALDEFVQHRPEADDYARFRAACDLTQTSWQNWPDRMRQGDLRPGDYDERLRRFHLYCQWQAQQQIDQLVQHCRNKEVKFYLDLPLGVHGASYDVWRERDSYAMSASVGAPPDMFFTKGQNWGFAPLHPERVRESGYRHVRDYLRFQMRHTQLLRIDHVMALHRLYWIPEGLSPSEGAYVRYPADELTAILSLESHRNRTTIAGENLGTVPREVNESMRRHGLMQMYVAQYEQRSDKVAFRTPPRRSVASLNTHDLPMFTAHWRGLDILDHVALGLVSSREAGAKKAARRRLNEATVAFLKREGVLKERAGEASVIRALLRWLARGPAEIVLVNLEDLLGETQPQNTPGTSIERPNWQRKMAWPLEKIMDSRDLREFFLELNNHRKR